jgi:hypothetical protein
MIERRDMRGDIRDAQVTIAACVAATMQVRNNEVAQMSRSALCLNTTLP